jgi:hypothetical protein
MQKVQKWMTLSEIGALIERNPSSLSRMCSKHGVTARRKDGKYHFPDVKAAMDAAARKSAKAATGSSREKKTALECKILSARLAQITGNVVTVEEHQADLVELALLFNGAMVEVERGVEAITRDASILKHVKHIVDATRQRISDKLKAEGCDAK